MFRILSVPISIAATGTSFDSDAINIPDGVKILGWEFTTPDYVVARTTTVSILTAGGRTAYTGSAINEATASVDILADGECPVVFSGFKVHAALAGATGSVHTFVVILFVEDATSGAIVLPSGLVTAMSFEHNSPALLDQADPVQNTWYTVLDTVHNVKVFGMACGVTVANETLEIRITVDGGIVTGSQAATFGSSYRIHPFTTSTGLTLVFSTSTLINSNICEARSFKVEMRKTTNAGNGNLQAAVCYEHRG